MSTEPVITGNGASKSAPATEITQAVVMGVAGCGKTTIGAELAKRLGRRFVDGDSLHPASNVAKMREGRPLTDADRWPWLDAVREVLRRDEPVVVACSALRRSYRDVLRGAPRTVFVFLDLDQATATARAASRTDHFMSAEMVAGQFADLECPAADEWDVAVVDATCDESTVVSDALAALRQLRPGTATHPPGSQR